MNEEREFGIGDRVRIIPNHICVAMNLHECVYGVRGYVMEQTWRVAGSHLLTRLLVTFR